MGPESGGPELMPVERGLLGRGRAKKFLASNFSLRRYSKAVPWISLLPDFVDTDTTPAPRPNSAEKVPVRTLNSRTDSTDGVTMTVLNVYSLLSIPSISQALVLACEPRALKFEAPRGLKVEAPERFSPTWPAVTPGQVDEGREVAAVERQLPDRPLLDDLAHLRGIGAGEGSERRHLGRLGEGAELEGHVDARALVDLQDDALPEVLLEALHLDRHLVGTGDQEGRVVVAGGCRSRGSRTCACPPR